LILKNTKKKERGEMKKFKSRRSFLRGRSRKNVIAWGRITFSKSVLPMRRKLFKK